MSEEIVPETDSIPLGQGISETKKAALLANAVPDSLSDSLFSKALQAAEKSANELNFLAWWVCTAWTDWSGGGGGSVGSGCGLALFAFLGLLVLLLESVSIFTSFAVCAVTGMVCVRLSSLLMHSSIPLLFLLSPGSPCVT